MAQAAAPVPIGHNLEQHQQKGSITDSARAAARATAQNTAFISLKQKAFDGKLEL